LLTASEIEELDNVFFTLTEKVALDKHALDQGLEEQIRLTREVHHRVKNNLQIIASLISLHSRTAESPEAVLAYTKIQRRVDALSVVQRNHYAGSEESQGINLRALVGEVAGSFQASGDDAQSQCIDIAIENVRVDQDIAVPVAFLLTEILDLVQQVDPKAHVLIDIKPLDDKPDKMLLTITSKPLGDNAQMDALLAEGIDRVLAGLARQLRTPFNRDRELSTVCVEIPLFQAKVAG
jgi:two-component system, sensor histidine kinase PdtaS